MINKKRIMCAICTVFLLISSVSSTFAWLAADKNTIQATVSGSLVTEYFHCGSGTEDDPFVITRPIHYYHMVEFFQRLTHLPVVVYNDGKTIVKFGTEYLYFQIGCPEEQLYNPAARPTADENTTYYVFDYDNTGKLITTEKEGNKVGVASTTLNMAYYSGSNALMPIGSSQVPFNGQLDGKGVTVSNLNIVTSSTVEVKEYDNDGNVLSSNKNVERKTCDVGIFGYIGPGGVPHGETDAVESCIKDVYFENVTIDLAGLDSAAVSAIEEAGAAEHHTSETIHDNGKCYAGYLAGHITLISSMQNVYVNNSTIVGGNAAEIGFGYFGCVEKKDGQNVEALNREIELVRGKGNDAGFGSSIDMKNVYTRVNRIASQVANNTFYYPTEETVIINEETGQTISYVTDTANGNTINQNGASLRFRHYSSTLGGSYFFNTSNGYDKYIYLTGLNKYVTKTTYTYRIKLDPSKTAFFISDASERRYLGVSSALNVISVNKDNATRWNKTDWNNSSESGKLSTMIGDTSYYLVLNGSSVAISALADRATIWHYVNGTLYAMNDDVAYYLVYEDGWKLTTASTTYVIGDGKGHYLNASENGVDTATSESSATEWYTSQSVENGTYSFYTVDANGSKYLALNNGLVVQDATFAWNYEEDASGNLSIYALGADGNKYYLTYDGGWTTVLLGGYYLSSDDVYMTANRDFNGVIATTTTNSRSIWQLSNPEGNTTIALAYEGKLFYLGCDAETGKLLLDSSKAITWYPDTAKSIYGIDKVVYYCEIAGIKHYLDYSDSYGWTTKTSNLYQIQAGETSNYLAMNLGTSSAEPANVTSNGEEYSIWELNNPSGDSRIFQTVSGENYYLCVENNTLVIRVATEAIYDDDGNVIVSAWDSANATVWKSDSLGRYALIGDEQYYLIYDNGTWKVNSYWYTISDRGSNYLTGIPGNTTDGTANDAHWHFSNPRIISTNGEESTIWINEGGSNKYLGFNGESLTATASSTVWHKDKYGYYVKLNDVSYYLTFSDGVWTCHVGSYNTISYDDKYLTIDWASTGVISSAAVIEKSKWQFKDKDNKLFVYIAGVPYYLNVSGSLALSVSTDAITSWKVIDNKYYTNIDGIYYGLSYENSSWKLVVKEYYTISKDGSYLALNGEGNGITGVDSVTDNAQWQIDNDGYIYVAKGSNKYYLSLSGSNTLTVVNSAADATKWRSDTTHSDTTHIYYSTQGASEPSSYDYHVYGIEYANGNWQVKDDHYGVLIKDGNTNPTNYLKVNAAFNGFENTQDPNEATRWVFSNYNKNGNSSGTISTTVNGVTKFIIYDNNNLNLGNNSAEWTNNENNFYYTTQASSGWLGTNYPVNHYLVFDELWGISRSVQGFKFRCTYNRTSYYMTVVIRNGAPAIDKTTDIDGAAVWSGNAGKISTDIDGQIYYIVCDDDSLYLSSTPPQRDWESWSTTTNGTQVSGKLRYQSGSSTLGANTLYHNIYFDGSQWTKTTDKASGFLNFGVTRGASTEIAFIGHAEPLKSLNEKYSPAIPTVVISNPLQSVINQSVNSVSGIMAPAISLSSSDGIFASFPAANVLSIASPITKDTASIAKPFVSVSEKTKASYDIHLTETAGQTMTGPETSRNEASGYPTYFPLRLELQDENDKTSFYSDYRVSEKNTGYIVSGAYQDSGNYHSDIRISRYGTNYIFRSLNLGYSNRRYGQNDPNGYNAATVNADHDRNLQVLTRTINSEDKYVRINDSHNQIDTYNNGLPQNVMTVEELGLTKYELINPQEGEDDDLARNQFAEVLKGSNQIYGLHFMESTISKDHTIYADQVTVNGETYYNYELPEDSIDCWLVERGSINFFAGSYYSSNVQAFFSLHQIFRDQYNKITDIKEISKVYQTENGVKDRYVYQYKDGSWSDGYTSQPAGYSLVFDLSWITNPIIVQNALYYFEIPVNAGEYALGSVENKIGAYLLYLDIATNGGALTSTNISSEGNEITDAYKVEFRTEPDKLGDGYYTILQFGIQAPANADPSTFSVNVSFDNNPGDSNYSNGLYTITVVNKSGEDLVLDVFLSDDDREAFNPFLYAYRIKYINGNSEGFISNNAGADYFQAMAIFDIPAMGTASESSYD